MWFYFTRVVEVISEVGVPFLQHSFSEEVVFYPSFPSHSCLLKLEHEGCDSVEACAFYVDSVGW